MVQASLIRRGLWLEYVTLGWWWADPLASLVIVYYGIREGMHAWRGEEEQHA